MADTPEAPPPDQTVPYARFKSLNDKMRAAEARVAELEASNQTLTERAATADTLAQQVEQWQTKAQQAAQGLTEYQAAAKIGVTDPELYEAARWAHSRLPEEDRPAFGDALAAWKEDPSAAPLVLRPHLQTPAAPPAAAPAPGAPPAAPPTNGAPPPNRGAQSFPEAPAAVDVMTMDLETYRQHRDKYKGTSLI